MTSKTIREGWEKDIRDFIDQTLKPKKPTMKNLERELIVDKIHNILASQVAEIRGKGEKLKYLEAAFNSHTLCLKQAHNRGIDKVLNLLDSYKPE